MAKQRQFDDEEVLGRISNYFWKHGYSATKVDQFLHRFACANRGRNCIHGDVVIW